MHSGVTLAPTGVEHRRRTAALQTQNCTTELAAASPSRPVSWYIPRRMAAILSSTMPQPDRPHGMCARTTYRGRRHTQTPSTPATWSGSAAAGTRSSGRTRKPAPFQHPRRPPGPTPPNTTRPNTPICTKKTSLERISDGVAAIGVCQEGDVWRTAWLSLVPTAIESSPTERAMKPAGLTDNGWKATPVRPDTAGALAGEKRR